MNQNRLSRLDPERSSEKAKRMFEFLQSKIRGQDRALRYVVRALERFDSPLRDKNKPIAVVLELGPSGVGKTSLAETLAMYLYGDSQAFTKIHCAEYSQPHEVARLKGSPPGYVGYVDQREDPFGFQYILGQGSIDKHHHEYLARLHKKDIDKLNKRSNELWWGKKQDLDLLLEKMKTLGKEIGDIKKKIDDLEKEIKANPNLIEKKKEVESLRKDLADREEKLKKYGKDYIKEKGIYNAEVKKLDVDFAEAAKKGWIYEPGRYPISNRLVSLILFDEIERADEDLFELLLEIMDKGRLQHGNDLITSYRNSIILLTSNVGQKEIADLFNRSGRIGYQHALPISADELDKQVYRSATEAAKKIFPPPFLGRLDKIAVFRPLSPDIMLEILELLMVELHTELSKIFPLLVKLDKGVKDYVIKQATKYPELGARLLKSRITDYIKDSLISLINTKQLTPADIVVVKLENVNGQEKLAFYKEEL